MFLVAHTGHHMIGQVSKYVMNYTFFLYPSLVQLQASPAVTSWVCVPQICSLSLHLSRALSHL